MLAACNAAFPVGNMDNLFAAEEHLRALLARIQVMVTKAVRQGAATALDAAQFEIGIVVNIWSFCS